MVIHVNKKIPFLLDSPLYFEQYSLKMVSLLNLKIRLEELKKFLRSGRNYDCLICTLVESFYVESVLLSHLSPVIYSLDFGLILRLREKNLVCFSFAALRFKNSSVQIVSSDALEVRNLSMFFRRSLPLNGYTSKGVRLQNEIVPIRIGKRSAKS
jgi:hypothetical protein